MNDLYPREPSSNTDQTIQDLSALVLRLTRTLRLKDPDHPLARQALGYLVKNNLVGSALRSPETRPQRTLLRVEFLGNDKVQVVIPAWDPKEGVKIPYHLMPSDVVATLEPGLRLYAFVNIGADSADQLSFSDFSTQE